MSCQRGVYLDTLRGGLLNIVIAAVQCITNQFFRTAITFPDIVNGRLERIGIMLVSRFGFNIGYKVRLFLILVFSLIGFHYVCLVPLTLVAVITRIGVGRILQTVR